MVPPTPEISKSDSHEFSDLPGALKRVAARAQAEAPPRIHLDPSRIRALARREKLPVLVLCVSSSLSGLAACVMVFLALHASPQDRSNNSFRSTEMTTSNPSDGAAASRGSSSGSVISNVSPASEPSDTDALFSPLYWELP